jgi:cardiolipin synthase
MGQESGAMNDTPVPEAGDLETLRSRVESRLRPLTFPNFLTLFRMAMVPFVVLAISDREFGLAFVIFVLAGLTDSLDGFIARRFHSRSLIGAYLDPVADKVLLTAVYIALTIPHGQQIVIPLWLAILALFRDFLIMLVALVMFVFEGIKRFPPSLLGKVTTATHVVTVAMVLVANFHPIPLWFVNLCFYGSFALVILSGFNYIYRASRFIETIRQLQQKTNAGES